jgi:hypothetical protein
VVGATGRMCAMVASLFQPSVLPMMSSNGRLATGLGKMGVARRVDGRHDISSARESLQWHGDDREHELGFPTLMSKILAGGGSFSRGTDPIS